MLLKITIVYYYISMFHMMYERGHICSIRSTMYKNDVQDYSI